MRVFWIALAIRAGVLAVGFAIYWVMSHLQIEWV